MRTEVKQKDSPVVQFGIVVHTTLLDNKTFCMQSETQFLYDRKPSVFKTFSCYRCTLLRCDQLLNGGK